jgi:hypothetical protein
LIDQIIDQINGLAVAASCSTNCPSSSTSCRAAWRRRPASPRRVAHNEQYRKFIKGYMLRHKVKPGITGWAQVNGLRGETETLDKMRARIQYDIDTMRN